jgi:Ca-activated chloride channel family protein
MHSARRAHFSLGTLGVAIAIASSNVVFGQESQPSPPPRTINLSLIVVDRANHSIDEIQKDEIRLLENNLPQTISSFSKTDKAVDYGIAIDNSGSVRPVFSPLLSAVRVFLQNHKPDDECFIERFISSDKIETVQEFTSDRAALLKPLSSLYIEGGQSAVVDAIYIAVKHVAQRPLIPQRRRALIIFTDGEDRASYYSKDQLLQLLRTTDVQVFAIGLVSDLDNSSALIQPPQQKARDFLKLITRESGGRVFFPNKKKELSEALAEIFHDIHTQYEISYQSSDVNTNNFHSIQIEVLESPSHEKRTATIRPGYYLTTPGGDSQDKKKKPKKP